MSKMGMLRVAMIGPLLGTLLLAGVDGFPSGPPEGACDAMFPNHGVGAQNSDPPYTITVSQTSYQPGDTLTVTITGTGGAILRGFLLQARRADPTLDTNELLGTFKDPVTDTKLMCQDGAVSHSNDGERNSVTATWTAPATAAGHIKFRATIVGQNKETFWTEVMSDMVTDPTAPAVGTTTPRAPSGDVPAFDTSSCGSTKSCLRSPSGCTTNCDQLLTWVPNGDVVDMEFSAKSDGWIAFGLSKDDQMGSDSVTVCIRNGDAVDVYQGFTNGKSAPSKLSPEDLGLTNTQGIYQNGEVRCTFSRAKNVADDKYYNTDDGQTYNILVAYGAASGGNLLKHSAPPSVSSSQADLGVAGEDFSLTAADNDLLKAHACLMIGAWMLCASLGLILARYYKPAWPNSTIFDLKVWFQLHRACMVLTLLLTVAGFVVIFVDVEDFTDDASYDPEYLRAHPILGIIVTALVIINPIMALFRCAPDAENRVIYNWAHWLVGILAHTGAVVNIIFGLKFSRSESITPDWLIYVVVGYVVLYILTWICLEVNKCVTERNAKAKQEELELTALGSPASGSGGREAQGLSFQYFVLVVYVIGVLALCGIMVAYIVIGDD